MTLLLAEQSQRNRAHKQHDKDQQRDFGGVHAARRSAIRNLRNHADNASSPGVVTYSTRGYGFGVKDRLKRSRQHGRRGLRMRDILFFFAFDVCTNPSTFVVHK